MSNAPLGERESHRWLVAPGWDRRDEPDQEGWLWFIYADGWRRVAVKGLAPTVEDALALAKAGV